MYTYIKIVLLLLIIYMQTKNQNNYNNKQTICSIKHNFAPNLIFEE